MTVIRHEKLDEKQKDRLKEVFQMDGLQACLKEANNNPEGIEICESYEQRLGVYIWNDTTGNSSKQIVNDALDRYRKDVKGISLFGDSQSGDILFHISEKPYLTYIKKGSSFAPSIEQCMLGMWEESIKEKTLYIYINPRPEKTIPPYQVWDSEITEEKISTLSVPAIKVGEVKIVNKKLLDDVKREYYSERLHKYDKLDSFTVKEHWYQELYKHGTLFDIIWRFNND